MMLSMHFNFQIILFAIGLGVGYWLLITANRQEGVLKTLGKVFGWFLIVITLLVSIFNCYYSIKAARTNLAPEGCPMGRMIPAPPGTPMMPTPSGMPNMPIPSGMPHMNDQNTGK